jgi:hypothetical protein
VKVAAGVRFNSHGLEIQGLCCSVDDQKDLGDIYRMVEAGRVDECAHILQFLWRSSLTSFHFVGPYYQFPRDQSAQTIHTCVMEVIRALHAVGFRVDVCVFDGAASNLGVVRIATRCREDPLPAADPDFEHYLLPPCSIHPVTKRNLWWMVDPVHQLKNCRCVES